MALETTMRHAIGSDSISLKVPGTRGLERPFISMVVSVRMTAGSCSRLSHRLGIVTAIAHCGLDRGQHPRLYIFIRCRYLIEF